MPYRLSILAFGLTLLATVSAGALPQDASPTDDNPDVSPFPRPSEEHESFEQRLHRAPAVERLADWHDRFSSEPHVAGSEGDRRLIEKMAGYMESMGLEVEIHSFLTYLAEPKLGVVQIVEEPEELPAAASYFRSAQQPLPLTLPVREPAVEGDTYLSHPDLTFGWNAYSGTGEVTAEVVYVNYGTREDFYRLRKLGISVQDKIVIARYGGNFRGFKAKFAEEAGAAGLIIFTDPGDAGYARGQTYPEGGWAGPGYIQRGSLKTLPYSGDPLTPFEEATPDAERLDPDHVALPLIPVQPIGWGAAYEILRRMTGDPVPSDWQGGLPLPYRLGGDGLKVRLRVVQERKLVETANVLGFLRGETRPDEWVVVGGHHDAWSFGAGDPNAGTILTFEAARAFSDAAKDGKRPDRTLVFAHWGAEEFGIIGSTEWVEGRRQELLDRAVAYINLDGAAMGKRFRASASPSLKALISDVTRRVPQAGAERQTVYETWTGELEAPSFGNLGGGSDHVGFYCHVGIPSANLGAGGSPGVSYHSNYENLAWYRKVVGDYEGAVMLTRVVNKMLAGLADAPLLPLDPVAYGRDLEQHLSDLVALASSMDLAVDFSGLGRAAEQYTERASEIHALLVEAVEQGQLVDEGLARANRVLLQMERQWLHDPGLPERPWFRNLFAATDPYSGYGAWMLPALRWAVEQQRPEPPPLPEPEPEESEDSETEGEDSADGEDVDTGEVPQNEDTAAEDTAAEDTAAEDTAAEEAQADDESIDSSGSETTSETTSEAEPATDSAASTDEPAEIATSESTEPTKVAEAASESDGAETDHADLEKPEAEPLLDLDQAQQLYLDALDRLSSSLDQLQALLPGEIVPDPASTADATDADEADETPTEETEDDETEGEGEGADAR